MSPFEQHLKDALARRAPVAQPREAAWGELMTRVSDATHKRHLAATALTAAALVLASIGVAIAVPRLGKGDRSVADFAAGAEHAGTFKVRGITTSIADGRISTMRITGEVDLEKKLVHLVQVTDQDGDAAILPGSSGSSIRFEIISTETHLYQLINDSWRDIARIAGDKEWIRMSSPDGGGHPLASTENPMSFLFPTDPTTFFDKLLDAASRFTEVGSAEIEGVNTTEHEVVIEIEQLFEGLTSDQRKLYQSLREDIGDRFVMHVWLGDDGLLYRQRYTLKQGDETVDVNFEFFDYGEPVDIQIPPDDKVADREGSGSWFGTSAEYESCTSTADGGTRCETGMGSGEECTTTGDGGTSCTFSGQGVQISPSDDASLESEGCTFDPESEITTCSAEATPAASP